MTEKYVLAVMDKDGILPEFMQWFELEVQAVSDLMTAKDREAYVFKVLHTRRPHQ